jgi:hypothetical protein
MPITVEGLISELSEWPKDARVIVTLVQGDKVPRRFEIDSIAREDATNDEDAGEIIIMEDGEF